MDEPIADILRGVLDGHVVLDRAIAEQGRFPAVDVLRSVSRSLPAVADIWFQSGLPDGFSMEWVFDRYDHTVTQAEGQR